MSRSLVLDHLPLAPLDFQVLLVLAREALYGYAILRAVAEESEGRLRPDVGSLYRVLARLERDGLVMAVADEGAAGPTPGRPRRYYRITARGHEVAQAEAARLRRVLEIAAARQLLPVTGADR